MKVVTLTQNSFEKECTRLRNLVQQSGYAFDSVVGIASGGVYVADAFLSGSAIIPPHFEVDCRRNTTHAKRHYLASMLARLPRPVNNLLRIIESRIYSIRHRITPPQLKQIALPGALTNFLHAAPRRVLVIDDAVDSGVTLASVVEALNTASPAAIVRTAVVTVTTSSPLIEPDYSLYHDGTLIRFPWSLDS